MFSVNVLSLTHVLRLPPSCPSNNGTDFDSFLEDRGDQIVLGDFNVHQPSRFSRIGDDRTVARGGGRLMRFAVGCCEPWLINLLPWPDPNQWSSPLRWSVVQVFQQILESSKSLPANPQRRQKTSHIFQGYIEVYCGPLPEVIQFLIYERDQRRQDNPLDPAIQQLGRDIQESSSNADKNFM